MKPRKCIAASLLAVTLLTSPGVEQQPAFAKGTKELSVCETSILDAAKTIANGRSIRISSVYSEHLSRQYRSYPADRPNSVMFVMQGRSTEDILASGQFMTILTTRIVNGCTSVGMVSFAMDQSTWFYSFGMVNGRVTHFECVDIGTNRPLRWGEQFCG